MRISDWSSDVCSSDLKVRSFSFAPNAARDGATKALIALHNNALELWNIPMDKEPVKSSVVELQGHRSDIRGVAASADRSEERCVGKECVSTCRSRVLPDH